jgi:hypothetical protein
MFIVMVVGNPNQSGRFLKKYQEQYDDLIWMANDPKFYENVDLFVSCGYEPYPPKGARSITWSGDDAETLERIYKTLGLRQCSTSSGCLLVSSPA